MGSSLNEYLEAWNSHDETRILALVTEDIVYEDVALGQRMVGKYEMTEFIGGRTFAATPDLMFNPELAHSTNTHYFVEWVMAPLGVRGVSVGTLRDGKVSSNRDYWNAAALGHGGEKSSGD